MRCRSTNPSVMLSEAKHLKSEILRPFGPQNDIWRGGDKRSFTLIETLVALTIFTIGAVAMFVVFPASSMALRQAKEYTNIGLLLEQQINLVKATPFDQAATVSITENLPAHVQKIDRTVSQDSTLSDLKHINIVITYQSKGRVRTDSVITYVVKN